VCLHLFLEDLSLKRDKELKRKDSTSPWSLFSSHINSSITAWDWYSTFCALAGVDPTDEKAKAAGLPPIDSISSLCAQNHH